MRGVPVFADLRGECTIDIHGKSKTLPPPPPIPPKIAATFGRRKLGEVSFVVPRREPKGYWVVAGDYSPTRYSERLYTFNQKNGETQLVQRSLADVEIDPRSNYWTATDSTDFVGKSRRMESFGYVGSLKTGRRWQITFGQVWTSNVQLRPGI